ncbi:MAG: efflux RND transporter permease subunit [Alistipes sp.]|nr:efflux RND transporter permease subunit [Alistipes sp.]
MFNITRYSTLNHSVIRLFVVLIIAGGIYSFVTLGKREDSTFTIKSAVLTCHYPGATPEMVESLVAEPLERELSRLSSVDEISSESHFGYCRLMVKLRASTPEREITEIWNELRRRVEDIKPKLPSDIGHISIADDFGDVYGIYYALTADEGYTWQEMRTVAKSIEQRIYSIEGVSKVALAGEQASEVVITVATATLAMFDIRPDEIAQAIASASGTPALCTIEDEQMSITLSEGATYTTTSDIENQLLTASDGKQYRLGDIMRVELRSVEPMSYIVRVDNQRAIGIAISSDSDVDVVKVGDKIASALEEIERGLPLGMELRKIYSENEIALEATNDFLLNLAASLAIVILLIIATMGWRSGIAVGSSLLLSVAMTMIVLLPSGETLNRTSLAGFIIAMGMLVDNAIVVTDNTSTLLLGGLPRHIAAIRGARQNRWGLLSATLIAIVSFLPLQLAPSSVAEIIRPLFIVIAVSLLSSWLLAITQLPELSVTLLRPRPRAESFERSAWFRPIVEMLIRYRWVVVTVSIMLLGLSAVTMQRMPQDFFPRLSKPMFRAEILLPEGYNIEATEQRLAKITDYLTSLEDVRQVSTTAGGTPPRYYLASGSYSQRPNYGNLLIELRNTSACDRVEQSMTRWVTQSMPEVWLRTSQFKLSPVPEATIEFGFSGENIDTLARLVDDAMRIMHSTPGTTNIRSSWGNRVPSIEPRYSELKGQRIGVDRSRMILSLELATKGVAMGAIRQDDKEIPILLRWDALSEGGLSTLGTMPLFSRRGRAYSIEQATSGFDFSFALPVIRRIDSERVMKAQCDPRLGVNTIALSEELLRSIERNIEIPEGYTMALYGDEESREESNKALSSRLPITLIIIVVLLVLLFGNYRDPIIVLVTLPLIFVGVVWGLTLSGKMFDFFSLLGLLGLVGMQIKSGVILLERIRELRREGMSVRRAAAQAATDRLSPVVTAAGTTILGLIPLVFDPMFGSMAVTIMGGLVVATLLVVALLPVVYTIFYNKDA